MRDDLAGYVPEHFADPGAVLVVDETGDPSGHRHDYLEPVFWLSSLCRRGGVLYTFSCAVDAFPEQVSPMQTPTVAAVFRTR